MARLNALGRARRRVLEEARLQEVKLQAQDDPKALIAEINAFDPTSLEHFHFTMYPEDDDPLWFYSKPRADMGWIFQAAVVDWLMGKPNPNMSLLEGWSPNFEFDPEARVFQILKARQLGITWVVMAIELWHMLFRPGSHCVAYSYNEEQSKKLIARAWLMFLSLPPALRDHVEVLTPDRGEPTEWIRVRHKESGLLSTIQSLPATKKAGHGDTMTFCLMDEAAYQDYCKQIFTACLPATARGNARLVVNSTANGVGNVDTEEGNFYHVLYATKRERGISFAFLPWNAEPTRDEEWYRRNALKLGEVDRNRQYPRNENDAFMLSGALFFDREALEWYRKNIRRPVMRGQFVQNNLRTFDWMNLRDGIIEVFEAPVEWRKYALAIDCATGRGADYTSMGIIDLETGTMAAELHAKIDAARAHVQAYALAKWYNTAKVAIERQGGYGESLIMLFRDGSRGLPPYGNMYRHTDSTRGNKPVADAYGIPMGATVRPSIVNGLAEWIRARGWPWVSSGLMDEMGTFAYQETGTSPRALEGCHDDRVMMSGIAVEMFRQYGKAATKNRKPRKRRGYDPHPSRSAS